MPDAWLDDNKLASFDPASYDPALGTSPCNALSWRRAPNGCQDQGFAAVSIPRICSIVPSKSPLDRTTRRFRVGRIRRSDFVVRGGVGQFFTRDPISGTSTRLVGANPPFTVGIGPETYARRTVCKQWLVLALVKMYLTWKSGRFTSSGCRAE